MIGTLQALTNERDRLRDDFVKMSEHAAELALQLAAVEGDRDIAVRTNAQYEAEFLRLRDVTASALLQASVAVAEAVRLAAVVRDLMLRAVLDRAAAPVSEAP